MSRIVSEDTTLVEELRISVGLFFVLISVFLTLIMIAALGWTFVENEMGHMPHLYPDCPRHLDRAMYGSLVAIASGAGAILLRRLGHKLDPYYKE
jgi:hypothetical protein